MAERVPIILTGNTLVDRAIQKLREVVNLLADDPANRSADTARSAIATSPTKIVHGLGRTPVAFVQTYLSAAATIFVVSADATTVTLQASAPCIASYRVW